MLALSTSHRIGVATRSAGLGRGRCGQAEVSLQPPASRPPETVGHESLISSIVTGLFRGDVAVSVNTELCGKIQHDNLLIPKPETGNRTSVLPFTSLII